jgi:hypothetical protein
MNNGDRDRLNRFEGKLDAMFEYEKERDAKICKQIENHEDRIRKVERNQNIMYGVALTITGFVIAVLKKAGIL